MGLFISRCFGNNKNLECRDDDDDDENLFDNEPNSKANGLIYRILKTRPKRHSKFLNRFWNKKDLLYSRLNPSANQPSTSNIHLQCLDARSLMMLAIDRDFAYRQDLNSECTSNYSNSLDLEWEHEYGSNTEQWLPNNKDSESSSDDGDASNYSESSNKSKKNRQNLIKRVDQNLIKISNFNETSNLTTVSKNHSNSSRRSTPDSLEWDVDQDQLKSENDSLDIETKELLNEIEQLKNRVLSETGATVTDVEDKFES